MQADATECVRLKLVGLPCMQLFRTDELSSSISYSIKCIIWLSFLLTKVEMIKQSNSTDYSVNETNASVNTNKSSVPSGNITTSKIC